jgi:spore germination protein YaaH
MENKKINNKPKNTNFVLIAIAVTILIFAGAFLTVRRYAPSNERMKLTDFFIIKNENEAAVIVNGEYFESQGTPYSVIESGKYYLSCDFVKKNMDDGYVYDSTEKVLRYTTDKNVISANAGENLYTVDKEAKTSDVIPVIDIGGKAYLSADWIKNYTDFKYKTEKNPNRIVVEKTGWNRKVATVEKDTQIRRHGGVKSKILSDIKKGQKVIILEEYTKWTEVLTDDGVIGCIQDRRIADSKDQKTKTSLAKREYKHKKIDGKVSMTWHQVTNASSNSSIDSVLKEVSGVNVISPTWFYINDNQGNIANRSSLEYVNKCHAKGIKVWGLISNLENKDVDTTSVLNTTSARDNLINQTVAAAIALNIDGINVDLEAVSGKAKSGYLEFIRELSLKCEKNDLFLSVDNYVPSEYTAFYGRKVQANYADYVVVMAYDEHFSGSKEAGSVSSIGFVKKGVSETLKEVPSNQLILGLPFYTRLWSTEGETVTSKALGMDDARKNLDDNGAEIKWNSEYGQNYGEYESQGKLYQCWLEDAESLGDKLQLVKDHSLAGVSFWKVGFESSEIWGLLGKYLN